MLFRSYFAVSPFENQEETPNDIWKQICQNVEEFNEDERFGVLLGMQWAGDPKAEGARQFLFAKGDKAILRKKEARSSSLKKIYKLFFLCGVDGLPSPESHAGL